MRPSLIAGAVVAVVVIIVALSSMFVVDQYQIALGAASSARPRG